MFPLFQFQIKALSSLARLRLLNVLGVRLRRLNPRRLDIILDLKSELLCRPMFRKACSWRFMPPLSPESETIASSAIDASGPAVDYLPLFHREWSNYAKK